MEILTPADMEFFEQNGYLRVPGVVPRENCESVIATTLDYLGMDPDDPEDWYRLPLTPGGMIELYQHQALWNNRQWPPLYRVFADLQRTERLWVSIDRVNLKPPPRPNHPEYDHAGFIHWDVDTTDLSKVSYGIQGVLYLADTDEDMGGFQCVPGFHRNLAAWIAEQPPNRNPRMPDLSRLPEGMRVTPIPGKAGDLVIWHKLLAHGNGRNLSDRPRWAQYIAMHPADEKNEDKRQLRIACWRERRPVPASFFPGDPHEPEFCGVAELTPLGRKLLGLDLWEKAPA